MNEPDSASVPQRNIKLRRSHRLRIWSCINETNFTEGAKRGINKMRSSYKGGREALLKRSFTEQDYSFWRVLRAGKAGGNWNEVTPALHQINVYFEKIVAGLAFFKGRKKGANMDAYLFAGCYVISGLSNGGRGREARASGHTLRKAFCKKNREASMFGHLWEGKNAKLQHAYFFDGVLA